MRGTYSLPRDTHWPRVFLPQLEFQHYDDYKPTVECILVLRPGDKARICMLIVALAQALFEDVPRTLKKIQIPK